MRISDWSSDVCSSDLGGAGQVARLLLWALCVRLTVSVLWSAAAPVPSRKPDWRAQFLGRRRWIPKISSRRSTAVCRSEEHTSELQSLMRISYAVFCLKKKKTNKNHNNEKTN